MPPRLAHSRLAKYTGGLLRSQQCLAAVGSCRNALLACSCGRRPLNDVQTGTHAYLCAVLQHREAAQQALLAALVAEPQPAVRRALADVISTVARHTVPLGEWPGLLEFLGQCSAAPQAAHREVALVLFAALTETIGDLPSCPWVCMWYKLSVVCLGGTVMALPHAVTQIDCPLLWTLRVLCCTHLWISGILVNAPSCQ